MSYQIQQVPKDDTKIYDLVNWRVCGLKEVFLIHFK